MIPAWLIPLAFRALKAAIAAPKLRAALSADIAREGGDVSPEVINLLSGDAAAIKLLDEQIDEGRAFHAGMVARLEAEVRRGGSQP